MICGFETLRSKAAKDDILAEFEHPLGGGAAPAAPGTPVPEPSAEDEIADFDEIHLTVVSAVGGRWRGPQPTAGAGRRLAKRLDRLDLATLGVA